ncbi:MAG: HisA/HisF-related TIM barrel protein [Lacunisphaera sp.]
MGDARGPGDRHPFCVAGGIRSLDDARTLLHSGADKVSLNSPAIENPELLGQLAAEFGSQCVVVGIDSRAENGDYLVKQFTATRPRPAAPAGARSIGRAKRRSSARRGRAELHEPGWRTQGLRPCSAQARARVLTIPLVASGGAGAPEHFRDVFRDAGVDAALAASVFHSGAIPSRHSNNISPPKA